MKKILILTASVLFFLNQAFSQENQNLIEHNDLSYFQGEGVAHELQKLNLVLPDKSIKNAPILLWIGGGAWSYVDKNVEVDLARKLAQEGIAVASIGHRLSSAIWRDSTMKTGVKHPAHVEDLAMAFKWLYDHAEEYGYAQDNMIVGGFSSGAHLAALLAMDSRYLGKWGLELSDIKGIIPISGTYDIVNYHHVFEVSETQSHLAVQHVQAVFGDTEADFLDASPITYMDHLSVPVLLISDNALANYTRIFEEEIKKANIENVEVVYVEEFGHAPLWRNLSHEENSTYRDMLVNFIKGLPQ